MKEQVALYVLYGGAAAAAVVAAIRDDWFPKVKKLALAVALAATGLLVQATDFLGK